MQALASLKTSAGESFAQGVEQFLLAAASRNLTAGSLRWYKQKLHTFACYLDKCGKQSLQNITEREVRAFLLELRARKSGRAHRLRCAAQL